MATETLHLTVRGMSCENCARTIQTKLARTPGVVHASVNLENAEATVEYDNRLLQPNQIAEAVRQLGYQVPS